MFVNRNKEIKRFIAALQQESAELTAIYGIRRYGKSTLIKMYCRKTISILYNSNISRIFAHDIPKYTLKNEIKIPERTIR